MGKSEKWNFWKKDLIVSQKIPTELNVLSNIPIVLNKGANADIKNLANHFLLKIPIKPLEEKTGALWIPEQLICFLKVLLDEWG